MGKEVKIGGETVTLSISHSFAGSLPIVTIMTAKQGGTVFE
jgi:hypothetical protein